jgi:hypothetical protein
MNFCAMMGFTKGIVLAEKLLDVQQQQLVLNNGSSTTGFIIQEPFFRE